MFSWFLLEDDIHSHDNYLAIKALSRVKNNETIAVTFFVSILGE